MIRMCRNLVQFLGACIAEDNLMLVLEYMAGAFLFLPKMQAILECQHKITRVNMVATAEHSNKLVSTA